MAEIVFHKVKGKNELGRSHTRPLALQLKEKREKSTVVSDDHPDRLNKVADKVGKSQLHKYKVYWYFNGQGSALKTGFCFMLLPWSQNIFLEIHSSIYLYLFVFFV